MRLVVLTGVLAFVLGFPAVPASMAQSAAPYNVILTKTVGGDGRFDYVYADVSGRRLYVPRIGPSGAISVFDLDTLAPVGSIANASGHGAVVDEKTHHAFGTSKPVTMWDSESLQTIKTIDVQGGPDGIAADPFSGRIYILSHSAPNATVIDAKDGSVVGTIDLGGAPEQTVSDDNGHLFVDIEDKGNIAVVDARTLTVTAHYDLGGKGGTCAGSRSTARTTSSLRLAGIRRRWSFYAQATGKFSPRCPSAAAPTVPFSTRTRWRRLVRRRMGR